MLDCSQDYMAPAAIADALIGALRGSKSTGLKQYVYTSGTPLLCVPRVPCLNARHNSTQLRCIDYALTHARVPSHCTDDARLCL